MSGPRLRLIGLILFICAVGLAPAQQSLTGPSEEFGFEIGADYMLVNYTQLRAYWQKLDRESDRLTLFDIGKTAEGRPMLMAVVTSPANHGKLNRYKDLSRRLALAEGLTENLALSLASEGRAVVQIDGGLHGTEILGSQQLIELVYQMVSGNDPETLRILDNVILLAIPSNPDGLELVADWYMREKEPEKRTMRGLPRLYQKYIGHDNNRDFYMITQPETEAVSRVMYQEWFPQIVYNHHQTGPAGTVLFCSPFRDPFNYYFDPLVPMGIDLVGSAMHGRFVAEGKPGATMRSGAGYSTWWSGGLRSTSYFHNMIGILTETIGNPTPTEIQFLPEKQLAKNDLPYPVAPQKWHFRRSIEYSITADKAILDLAAKLREDFLMNMYRMGRNSIDRGSRDHWTVTPKRIQAVQIAMEKDQVKPAGFNRGYPVKYYDLLRDPAARDPRGYIIPADQPDFATAVKFVNTLIKSGITVERATGAFAAAGKTYPQGSLIVRCAQAFRPHILAMFEPQDHPHDVQYPGGPPIAPYDSAGWTLAFQMGIAFDRILEGFDGPFEIIKTTATIPPGHVVADGRPAGYLLDHRVNDTFIATNRLLKQGADVYWLKSPVQVREKIFPAGSAFVPAQTAAVEILKEAASSIGLNAEGLQSVSGRVALKLNPVRIGLWDQYGGSMNSGWTRWILEQFEFPVDVVFPPELDAGDLRAKYDVLIFPGGALPRQDRQEREEFRVFASPKPEEVPEEYRNRLGAVTTEKTVPQLRRFLEAGGTILALGNSTSLAQHLDLSISDALVERFPDGKERRLPRERYYIPGSVLEARVDNSHPLGFGLNERTNFYFNNSPAFLLNPDSAAQGVHPVAWFDGPAPLRSGWAWGQHYLDRAVAVLEATVGQGRAFFFGPEILFRGQPHGTFKLLFNGIYYGQARETVME